MEIGDKTRHVISKSVRNRHGKQAEQVVYKTAAYRVKGVMKYISQTRHESR